MSLSLLELKKKRDLRQREQEEKELQLQRVQETAGIQLQIDAEKLTEDLKQRLQYYKTISDDIPAIFEAMQQILLGQLQKYGQNNYNASAYEQQVLMQQEEEEDDTGYIQTDLDRKCVFLKRLNRNTIAEDINTALKVVGKIVKIELEPNKIKNTARIQFETEEQAYQCAVNFKEIAIKGSLVKVELCKTYVGKSVRFK